MDAILSPIPDLASVAERDLLRLARDAPSREAQGELWQRQLPMIYRLVRRGLAHCPALADQADDVVQELYFVFPTAVREFDPDWQSAHGTARFSTFVYALMKRRLHKVKRAYLHRELSGTRTYNLSAIRPPLFDAPRAIVDAGGLCPLPEEDPAVEAEVHETVHRVQLVYDALDPADRRLWSDVAEGQSLRTIAKQAGRDPKTVRTRWVRLRRTLEARIEAEGD